MVVYVIAFVETQNFAVLQLVFQPKSKRYSLPLDWFFTRIGKGDLLGMASEVSENNADTTRSSSTMAFSANPPRLAPTTLFQVR